VTSCSLRAGELKDAVWASPPLGWEDSDEASKNAEQCRFVVAKQQKMTTNSNFSYLGEKVLEEKQILLTAKLAPDHQEVKHQDGIKRRGNAAQL